MAGDLQILVVVVGRVVGIMVEVAEHDARVAVDVAPLVLAVSRPLEAGGEQGVHARRHHCVSLVSQLVVGRPAGSDQVVRVHGCSVVVRRLLGDADACEGLLGVKAAPLDVQDAIARRHFDRGVRHSRH
eukprot:scaffold89202_cov69-Phaeocystis_antarctica.AAC.2